MNLFEGLKLISQGKALLILGLCFIVLLVLIQGQPFGVAELKKITDGVGMLDLERNYTPAEAYQFLDSLGETGRAFHIQIILWLDLLFPISYALFFAAFIGYFIAKIYPRGTKLLWVSVFPLLAGLFDYLENTFELVILFQYPRRLYDIACLAGLANGVKYSFNAISLGLMIVSLGWFLVMVLRKSRNKLSV